MKFIKISIALMFVNTILQAQSMEDTLVFGNATGAICKVYAEEVGGNSQAFADMNVNTMTLAKKFGYLNDIDSYLLKVSTVKDFLQKELLKQHGSHLNVYNNWCIRAYNGYVKGAAKAYD